MSLFNINFIITVLVQVLCIFIFLTVFFFTYAAKIEGQVVENQVLFMSKDIVGIHLKSLEPETKEVIIEQVNKIPIDTPENKKIGEDIDKSNDQVKSRTRKIITILTVGVLLIVAISYFLSQRDYPFFKDLNLKTIFKETAIIVLSVALTEYYFLTYLGSKYISVDPNRLKAHALNNITQAL